MEQVSQPQAWHQGEVHSRGTHVQQDVKEDKGRAPICRDNLRGKCSRGFYCKFQHTDSWKHNESRFFRNEKQNSQFCGENNDWTSSRRSLFRECISTSPCRYFLSGCCLRGSTCPYLHASESNQVVHVGSVPLNYVGVNAHHIGWAAKEQLACDRDATSMSWSSERKRSWPVRNSGGDELKREFCLKFTKGRCFKGANCEYFHSFHEYATSVSHQCATTMVTQEHDTYRNDKMHSRTTDTFQCSHAEQKSEDLATDCLTVDISEASATNQEPVESNLTSSSKCGVESLTEEVTDTSSRKLTVSDMERISSDHLSVMSVLDVQLDISTSVPITEAIREEDVLLGNADNSSLPVSSQPLDTAILKSRRKLLVLDVDGLLADIVAVFPVRFKPDFTLEGEGVSKRPFCDDFLQFCFENFDVGIWSSRAKKNVTGVVDFLMKNTKNKLLFCWDHSHCTETDEKPLVLKELKKLWENQENDLPWQRGFYNESNTILLDVSPYKGIRNPPYTAVYPMPYSFEHIKDHSLGPDGDLRLYLERLAEAVDVQNFIRENPFG